MTNGEVEVNGTTSDQFKVLGNSAAGRTSIYGRNASATGNTSLIVDNNRGSLAAHGGLLMGGQSFSTNFFGVSCADRTLLYNGGASGAGLLIGTLSPAPVIFGTNNIEIFRLSDTAALTARFSYNTNLGSTFTRYSLVPKHYVDSAIAAAGGGGSLSGSGTSGQLALWNGTSSFTGNSSILWGTSNGPRISVGTTNTQGVLNIGGDKNLSSSGAQSYLATATYTDVTTAASGTASSYSINYIGGPTIAATNTSVTFPAITTLTIDAPTAGTNATITKRYAITTGTNGHVLVQGDVEASGTLVVGGAQYNAVATITADATLATNVYWIEVNATSGNITITLPAASSVFTANRGITYMLARVDASGNTVTVQRAGSDTIGAAGTSFSLNTADEVKSIQCVANNKWRVY